MENCIFCRIVNKEAPATILFEDESVIVIQDQHPIAPVHLLVIPKQHANSLNELTGKDESLLGHLILVGRNLARQAGIAETGFRIVINTGPQAGQSVFHLHVHVIGGKPLSIGLQTEGLR